MKNRLDVSSVLARSLVSMIGRAKQRGWLDAAQRNAQTVLSRQGLPGAREEAWRFTPLQSTVSTEYALPESGPTWSEIESRAEVELGPVRGLRVFLAHGEVRCIECADVSEVPRVSLSTIGHDQAAAWAIAPSTDGHSDGFALLNEALAVDGVAVRIPNRRAGVADVEIVIAEDSTTGPTLSLPRYYVELEEGVEARLTEMHLAPTGSSEQLAVGLGSIRLGRAAVLEHVRVVHGSPLCHSIATLEVSQSRDSRYRYRSVAFGGALSRLDLRVRMAAQGAECELDGLYLADRGEIVDQHTLIDHAQGDCSSRQLFKGIVNGDGRAVFDGTVVVRRDAQRTSARQENRNLVLSNDAVVFTKPHLEIDADDVVCSHGATVGQLREEEVFYLRSRGIDERTARAMLTYSFAREMLERIPEGALRERLNVALLKRLPAAERLVGVS